MLLNMGANRRGGQGIQSESVQARSVTQSCLTLCDPMVCSRPGSSVHRISRARMLEWVPISFSRGIFPTQGLNLCLLHWQADSFQGNHQGRLVYGVDIVILKLNFNCLSIIYLILPLQAIKSNYNVSTDILVKNVTVFKTINTSAEKQRSNVNMYEKKQQ